ncbi:MAG TPA: tail fiber protein [Pyrinomonadaceae bacterium]
MPEPYVGEIRMFAGNFPPVGWMFCDGQLLPISENETLFNLIGTTYGGDGESTFALPNLQSRVPMHQGSFAGQTFTLGEAAGVESVTLTIQQIPVHTHALLASDTLANSQTPSGNMAARGSGQIYTSGELPVGMSNQSITPVGGSQPHENLQPYLCINFIISLFGIYPQPN